MIGPDTPCEAWADIADLCCEIPEGKSDLAAACLVAATEYLYDRTCRRWPGTSCTAIVRPCLPCECGFFPWGWIGYGWNGYDFPPLGRRGNGCRCRWKHYAIPSPYPILSIDSFTIGPDDHTADLRLDSNREATLLDASGLGCFPIQNLGVDDNAEGAWTLGYTFGAAPIQLAKIAAGDLACELLAACTGGECKLPDGATSVTKRGVTVTFRGPQQGFTNVETADLLISGYACPSGGTRRIIDPTDRIPVYRGTQPPPPP